MRAVIQRVLEATVKVDSAVTGQIGHGLMVLLGIEEADTGEDVAWLCQKIVAMRIFNDADGLMNLSVTDVAGGMLLVSQFTLYAATKKGNRPSFIKAAKPPTALPLYKQAVAQLSALMGNAVNTGIFGADMKVHLVNDGPVTIIIDSKNRE